MARGSINRTTNLCAGAQIGGARPYQEDYFRFHAETRDGGGANALLVLADGMGGHAGGAEASETAVTRFIERFEKIEGGPAECLRESLRVANEAVGERAAQTATNMGCTLVGCLVAGDDAHWISVGDSPLWLLDGEELRRLNADHSMRPLLEEEVAAGRMTPEELAADYRVHQLRSAVMGLDLELVDQNPAPLRLQAGQQLILASDGIETLAEKKIAAICAGRATPADAARALLDAVEQRRAPQQDNATVLVYRHPAAPD